MCTVSFEYNCYAVSRRVSHSLSATLRNELKHDFFDLHFMNTKKRMKHTLHKKINMNEEDACVTNDQPISNHNENTIEQLLRSLTNAMHSMNDQNRKRFDSLTKECECLRRENREILSAIEEMKTKIGDVHEVVNPAPIWKLITDHPDIFEKHVLKSGYLNGSDLKFFYGTNTDTRLAIKRANIELRREFRIEEMSSISQLEFAWDNYHWCGDEEDGTQEDFFFKVAEMNKLEYLVWAREVKNCAWDSWTIDSAAYQGNLAMVKYCVDNGCPMDAWTCLIAASEGHLDVLKYLHENDCPWNSNACFYAHLDNHVDCLNYLIEQKCEGFERYV